MPSLFAFRGLGIALSEFAKLSKDQIARDLIAALGAFGYILAVPTPGGLMIRVLSVVLFGACLVALGSAENSFANVDQKPSTFVLCKNQKNVRTIKVLPDQAKPENCTITYMKGGVDEVVGSGRSMDNCRSIVKNIKSNLESSNWSCRSVQSASVMQSAEVARQ